MRSFSLLIVLFTTFLFNNEPRKDKISLVTIHINGGSYLKIHGRTNLNKFHCQYIKSLSDTLLVTITRDETDKLILENADISLNVLQFDCGNGLINKDFRKLLRAKDFPLIKIEALDIESDDKSLKKQGSNEGMIALSSAHLKITIAGKENDYELAVDEPEGAGNGTYSGTLQINIRDFGLTPPRKFLGLMKVNEKVDIDFYLKLSFLD